MKKFAAALRAAKLFSIYFSSASRGTAWPLHFTFASYAYGMYRHKVAGGQKLVCWGMCISRQMLLRFESCALFTQICLSGEAKEILSALYLRN